MVRVGSSVPSPDICTQTALFRKIDPQHHLMVAWLHHLVNQFLIDGHLGCFQFLSIINKAAMNILVHGPSQSACLLPWKDGAQQQNCWVSVLAIISINNETVQCAYRVLPFPKTYTYLHACTRHTQMCPVTSSSLLPILLPQFRPAPSLI